MINTKKYTAKTFDIKNLIGISTKNIEEHLKLYAGYVKSTNLIIDKINEYQKSEGDNAYEINELRRRFAFEFGGVINHEYYFSSLSGGTKKIEEKSTLYKSIVLNAGSFENWITEFKSIAITRGVGWAMLYYDKKSGNLINHWVDEQHIGHLVGLSPILCLDMWEHAFVYDFATSEKSKYVEAFFKNLNWSVIEENFIKAQ